jgi:hypothetical protein
VDAVRVSIRRKTVEIDRFSPETAPSLAATRPFDPVPADTPEETDTAGQIGSYGWKAGTPMACLWIAGAAQPRSWV